MAALNGVKLKYESCVSAPGKLILTGEHSVVYGKVALAASLNLRTALRVTPAADHNVVVLALPDVGFYQQWTIEAVRQFLPQILPQASKANTPRPLSNEQLRSIQQLCGLGHSNGAQQHDMTVESLAVVAFWHLFTSIACADGNVPAVAVTVRSQLPIGAGLGSSAAYSVCLAAGLLDACHVIKRCPVAQACWDATDTRLINDWAFMAEKVIHGTPSGIDNSISTFGGALRFIKGQPSTQLQSVPQIRILLTNTKVPRSTKKLVAGVRERKEKFPTVMDPLLESMDALSSAMENVLVDLSQDESQQRDGKWRPENTARLGELIDVNQHLLNAIGVGHSALDAVCTVAAAHGARAKLTGAGGGGCAFVLLQADLPAGTVASLCAELQARGYTTSETTVGSPGVRLDTLIDKLDAAAGGTSAAASSPSVLGAAMWIALSVLPGMLASTR
eukprot:m.1638621 g.1638621  ORF g.1638621 m.1638621 type:complete len:447 (-) comp29351_c0_seq1:52-1392(-)